MEQQAKWKKSSGTLAIERREARGRIPSWQTDPVWRDYILHLRCGAKNRRGEPCKIMISTVRCANGKYRCRYHGGLSTGPRTAEGKAKVTRNLPRRPPEK